MYLSRVPRLALILAIGGLLFTTGCDQSATEKQNKDAAGGEGSGATAVSNAHEGWWCDEHGVPEGECTRCNASLVSDFKEKGDWCDEHARPESQCFLCDPDREADFAKRYKTKEGKDPPPITDP